MKEAIRWELLKKEQQDQFLMNGNIDLVHWYISSLDTAIDPSSYTKESIDIYLNKIKYKVPGESYSQTDVWLYNILDRHDIRGKHVAIMGSIKPWYEAICLHYGGIPTTLEYNTIIPEDNRIVMLSLNDYWKKPFQFDLAFSISTFEHDGLGRYGDPIDPNGDFRAMSEMKNILKKDALLFLAVPIGKDKLVWNAHRKYGPIRFPYLVDGWELVDQEGFTEELYERDTERDGSYQPVFILKNI